MKKNQADPLPPLLNYTPSTVPSPLQVSTQTPTGGQIIFAVAANADVLCKQIVISVPVGANVDEIYSLNPTPTATTDSANWSLSTDWKPGDQLGYDPNINYTVFTLTNNTAGFAVKDSFKITIKGYVNTIPGSGDVQLREFSSPVINPSYSAKGKPYTMTKSNAPAFYVRNFISTLPGTPTVPATEFGTGAGFRLAWDSNGTFYKVFMKGNTQPIYSGTATSFQMSGITTDTTFVLAATLDQATLYEVLTVTVSNPSLTPQTVATKANESIGTTLTVGDATTLKNTTVNGTLGVTGNTNVGSTTVNGTLTVSGGSTLGVTTVNGNFTVPGNAVLNNATLGTATVNGSLTANNVSLGTVSVNGALTARSAVFMMGNGTMLASGTQIAQTGVYAKTDGFAIAFCLPCADNGKSSFAYGYINTIGTWFGCLGGTVGSFGSGWSSVMNNNQSVCCIPIKGGTTWWYFGANPGGSQMNSVIQIYWFPMGTVASMEESTYEIVAEGDATQDAPAPPPDPFAQFQEMRSQRYTQADIFISKLEFAFNKPIEAGVKSELASLLTGF